MVKIERKNDSWRKTRPAHTIAQGQIHQNPLGLPLEAGSHTPAPGVPITTGRSGVSPGRALVPYRRAGTPAMHDTRAAGRSVTAGPASVCGVSGGNHRNDGEMSRDQKGLHFLPSYMDDYYS